MRTVLFSAAARGTTDLSLVRSILDAVASRVAGDAWLGRLTDETLRRVKMALRQVARRKVFIVVREISEFSNKHADVLWTVGRALQCSDSGDWVIASRTRPTAQHGEGRAVHTVRQVVEAAGFYHDLGKNNQGFQKKIAAKEAAADRFRHEVLSLAQLRGIAWKNDDLLQTALPLPVVGSAADPQAGMDWVEYLVLAHHRLPGSCGAAVDLEADKHINSSVAGRSLAAVDAHVAATTRRDELRLPVPGRMDFVLSRLALMLADHFVSSVRHSIDATKTPPGGALRAQVLKAISAPSTALANPDDARRGWRGQSLSGHLQAVGRMARVIAPVMADGRWMAGLPLIEKGRFVRKAGREGRYAWQQDAAALCARYAKSLPPHLGGLVLVGASTGSGKTRGCLAMADALCGGAFRVTTALALRTLTLQTGGEYRDAKVFDLTDDEIDVLIGSRAVLEIDAYKRRADSGSQKGGGETAETNVNPLLQTGRDDGIDVSEDTAPEEMELRREDLAESAAFLPFIETQCTKRGQKRYLDVPVLVTTLDQIVRSADHRRAGWILPWLRLSSSNVLILDEVDNYDLNDFPVLLRLVEFAAMLGVHLILSSATLYPAFVNSLVAAWKAGTMERARFKGIQVESLSCALVGDKTQASRIVSADVIEEEFARFVDLMTQHLPVKRLARLCGGAATPSRRALFDAIYDQALELHTHHSLRVPGKRARMSMGLVRMAHVVDATGFAQYVDSLTPRKEGPKEGPLVRIVLYHSQNSVLARSLIEMRLDQMLTRKQDPLAPLRDPDAKNALDQAEAQGRDLCLIVVATPVEEVGRDHDFDWAVIEPSSARSIVQTCGRVLRHRPDTVDAPNVAVLAQNFRAIKQQERNEKGTRVGPCFRQPGFEPAEGFPSHDMASLLFDPSPDERKTPSGLIIDARLCLRPAEREIGHLENLAIQDRLAKVFSREWADNPVRSMVRNHYANHRLRGGTPEIRAVLDFGERVYRIEEGGQVKFSGLSLTTTSNLKNVGLWRLDWMDIAQQFPGLQAEDDKFWTMPLPDGAVKTALCVDPLWGYSPAKTA
jgi:CRISPR-associated endonuclease/helicase Cas3